MANARRKIIEKLFISDRVAKEFKLFSKSNPGFNAMGNPLASLGYVARLNWAEYRRKSLKSVATPKGTKPAVSSKSQDTDKWRKMTPRKDVAAAVDELKKFDVISFDIFDTAVFRKVDKPDDVFSIMAAEMGFPDFRSVRKGAESRARRKYSRVTGNRELTIDEIYDVLENDYGIGRKWQQREIDLEVSLAVANQYIYNIYRELLAQNKTVVFTTDMYLPRETLERILHSCGYESYDLLLISNEEKVNKGSGRLQQQLKDAYAGKAVVHIGDNYASDYEKSLEAGIAAVFNPDSRLGAPSNQGIPGDVAGSYYRALVNNRINSGLWSEGKAYTHGYRVGGILLAGYCHFINAVAERHKVEKILFCARDCKVVHEAYNSYYRKFDNSYVEISRHAILSVAADRYYYDLINRSVLREAKKRRNSATLAQIFDDTGFGYLTPLLEGADIDRFLFPCALKEGKLEDFLYSVKKVVIERNSADVEAAKAYFAALLGGSKKILIVDVGWTGTCISALRYFISEVMGRDEVDSFGSLLCTSKSQAAAEAVGEGRLFGYLCSPYDNRDILSFFMPQKKLTTEEADILHMPLEYLFTSDESSLIRYAGSEKEGVAFVRTHHAPRNISVINDMQRGMLDFCREYSAYSSCSQVEFEISAYLASQPIKLAIKDRSYLAEVYGSFLYDATAPLYGSVKNEILFEELLMDDVQVDAPKARLGVSGSRGRLLFVTPEMTYTGTPRSMLRICNIAKAAGYEVDVWSQKGGPFIQEYKSSGLAVSVVPPTDLSNPQVRRRLSAYDLVICNTIATDDYVRACDGIADVAWYIREATNVPDFCAGNEMRLRTLQTCDRLICVSEYAAEALRRYTNEPIRIVKNAVEDLSALATSYISGTRSKVSFIQLGTMEYRKGYDLCVAAYRALPKDYQERVEMKFAGGFINSGTSYCSYLFSEIDPLENVEYLGILDEVDTKIEVMSESDVVIVASRDESCSLVALEGAMLSKPLIVTDRVGAKYIVGADNGWIVPSGDVYALRDAIVSAVDSRERLAEMGAKSRVAYEECASMKVHTEETLEMIQEFMAKGVFRSRRAKKSVITGTMKRCLDSGSCEAVVSLTSHPGRINSVAKTVESLMEQSLRPKQILLWLSAAQFPGKEADLPSELIDLERRGLSIRWVEEDLGPHKKYLYIMRENKTDPIIIVDDDVEYGRDLILELYRSYSEHPNAISCMRANLMLFRPDGALRKYDDWVYDYTAKKGYPTYQLLPTGVGGVLYPPKSIPSYALDAEAIEKTCKFADDLWLKFAATQNGYPTILPRTIVRYKEIPGTQDVALWSSNANMGRNDIAIANIVREYEDMGFSVDEILQRMRCVGEYGQWIGPDEVSYSRIEREYGQD